MKQTGRQPGASTTRTKLITMAILALLAAIIILQNTDPVQTRILFFTLTLPRAVLLFAATLIGFSLGVITVLVVQRRRQRKPPDPE